MKEDRRTTETKEVIIDELPESYYKDRLVQLVKDPKTATIYVAAILGGSGDWGAYIGWPRVDALKDEYAHHRDYLYYATNVHEQEDVIERGDKMGEEMAIIVFPNWSVRKYRE